MMLLEVAVAAPLFSTLTYSYPGTDLSSSQTEESFVGKRALVPLGKRIVTGYILGRAAPENVEYTLKEIKELLDNEPLFHQNSVSFFRWIADYYHHPIGEVISTALPSGLKRSTQKVIRLTEKNTSSGSAWPFRTMESPAWYEELVSKRKLSPSKSKKILSSRGEKKFLSKLVEEGVVSVHNELVSAQIQEKKELCYVTEREVERPLDVTEPTRDSLRGYWQKLEKQFSTSLPFSSVKALYFFSKLAAEKSGSVPRSELLKLYKNAARPLGDLVDKGILRQIRQRIYRNPLGELPEHYPRPDNLSSEQQAALEAILKPLESKLYSAHLLFGVTGGGKTEVYLRAAENCIQHNRDVLVLVPEIALATQLESHFLSRFPEKVALLHSGLSRGQRFDQWTLAASGKAKIVIGARSGVFAPLRNLGLIIVDEEHDSGFKQDDGLRYNARDLAVLRARDQECCVVLGSATPSITSYHNGLSGKYNLLTIENRIGESILPEVKILDLNTIPTGKKKVLFREEFLERISRNLEKGEQSLVLNNRRGFSTSYLCQECGTSVLCRDCNVTLTYHKLKNELRCHYCGYSTGSSLICDNCHSDKLIPFGVGTERVEEELRNEFPQAVIARLDSDTASDRNHFLRLLKQMRDGEIDILIGTQMIAKGHHFPNVTFVGVVWADGGLNMPDFRASERTYQLLSQVTGRAGRGERKGRVIIQTMRPSHYAIECAQKHRYDQFFTTEIENRKHPAFPPFVRLVQFRINGENEHNVRKTSFRLAAFCRSAIRSSGHSMELLGPAPAPLEKISKNYRWQILLKGADIGELHTLVHLVQKQKQDCIEGKTAIHIDIDPENMM